MKIFLPHILLSGFMLCSMALTADPWGKDADLAHTKASCTAETPNCCKTPLIGPLAEALIGFHQDIISPADGPRSHYLPSSSQYTLESMRRYGFVTGFFMGCDRLMRENDEIWVYKTHLLPSGKTIKVDPVP